MKLPIQIYTWLSAFVMFFSISIFANAASHNNHTILLDDAWVRAPAPGLMATVGFVVLNNQSHADDRLVAAYSDIAKGVELHTMTTVDGVMSMRKMDNGFALPMGQSVMLKPGGFHIMFLGLQQKLIAGDEVPVVLEFEHAGKVKHVFAVKQQAGMAHGDHKMHQNHSENSSGGHDHSHAHTY